MDMQLCKDLLTGGWDYLANLEREQAFCKALHAHRYRVELQASSRDGSMNECMLLYR